MERFPKHSNIQIRFTYKDIYEYDEHIGEKETVEVYEVVEAETKNRKQGEVLHTKKIGEFYFKENSNDTRPHRVERSLDGIINAIGEIVNSKK